MMKKFGMLAALSLLGMSFGQAADTEKKVPFSVLKGWNEARVQEATVLVLKDEATYTKAFADTFGGFRIEYPSGKPPVPEKVDFQSKQVVALCWGEKTSTGYEISVVSVTGTANETTITVKTIVPTGIADPAITYPVVALVIPKTEVLRVIVTGDRTPRGQKDFSAAGLEVIVK
jgi:hypothetical protein